MKVAIFDSGVGGLTVLYSAMKQMPYNEYIYYADLDNVPYGNKDKDLVNRLTFRAVEQIYDLGVDAIVLACNTATSISADLLRNKYEIPIIGMEPAVKPAVMNSSGKRVLVMATELTLKESKLKNLIDRLEATDKVDLLPMSEMVDFAEEMVFESERVTDLLDRKFSHMDVSVYKTVVLGCTHFIYFKQKIEKYFNYSMNVIDGNQGTVNHLEKILQGIGKGKYLRDGKKSVQYYVSGRKAKSSEFQGYMDYLEMLDI
ncbi:MAG: glutamate racemase [Eubacteriales bacterium]|nr:glutamate racemase [Eubacteriales bacterium]